MSLIEFPVYWHSRPLFVLVKLPAFLYGQETLNGLFVTFQLLLLSTVIPFLTSLSFLDTYDVFWPVVAHKWKVELGHTSDDHPARFIQRRQRIFYFV